MLREIPMTANEARVLFSLIMCSDPTPLSFDDDKTLIQFANDAAGAFGFQDWVEAYHELE